MKATTGMPTKGQFIRCWVWDDKVWSATCKWREGMLYEYDSDLDDFRMSTETDSSAIGGEEVESIWIIL